MQEIEKLADALPGVGPSDADLRAELQALIVELLSAVPRLAARLAGEIRLGQAICIPVLRTRRTARLETRCIVARQEPYRNQRLPPLVYRSAAEADPWAVSMEPPDDLNPARELRLQGSERRVRCRECEGRGGNACAVCGPASAASCPACGGHGLVACARCAETGDQLEYLVLESRHGAFSRSATRALAELACAPVVSDFEHAAGKPLLRIRGRGRPIERLPELPWPEAREDLAAALAWLELPAGTGCVEDTIELDALFALKAPWELDGRKGWIEAVRDASLRQADPGLADALCARAARIFGSPQEWLSQPEWMISLALEALDWPGAVPVHEAALAGTHRLAQELLESGRIDSMAELGPRIADLASHPAAGDWCDRLATVLASHHRLCAARFRMLLDTDEPLEEMRAALDEALASAQSPGDVSALHAAAVARVTDLLKAQEPSAAGALAEALSRARWTARQLAADLRALKPERLQDRARAIEEALDGGIELETAFFETMTLAATAPWLPGLERVARAFSQRLRDGKEADKAVLAQRLRDGFGRTRPELAMLFADVAGDRRDGPAINIRAALARPNGLPVAVDILLLDGITIADDALARDIAQAFEKALARKLEEEWLLEAEDGRVERQTELELRRALDAWRKLQSWSLVPGAIPAFDEPLRRFLEATGAKNLGQ